MGVRVDGGKYDFEIGYAGEIPILRYGEIWHRQGDASGAIGSLVRELDAARVVLDAARRLGDDAPREIKLALVQHGALVDDRERPSEWADPFDRGPATVADVSPTPTASSTLSQRDSRKKV